MFNGKKIHNQKHFSFLFNLNWQFQLRRQSLSKDGMAFEDKKFNIMRVH